MCSRYPQFRSTKIGPLAQRLRLQIFQVGFEWLVRQIANHVIIGRHRVVAQELTQANQRLLLGQAGRRHVRLKLQKLQFDLEIIAFPDVARFELCFANIDGLLEAFRSSRAN